MLCIISLLPIISVADPIESANYYVDLMTVRLNKRVSRPVFEPSEQFDGVLPFPSVLNDQRHLSFRVNQFTPKGAIHYTYSGSLLSGVISLDVFEGFDQKWKIF